MGRRDDGTTGDGRRVGNIELNPNNCACNPLVAAVIISLPDGAAADSARGGRISRPALSQVKILFSSRRRTTDFGSRFVACHSEGESDFAGVPSPFAVRSH